MQKIRLGKKNQQESKTENKRKKVMQEDVSKRSEFAKHYDNGDGTFTMEISASPIHYFEKRTKRYEEIDNTLLESNEGVRVKANRFNLMFAKKTTGEALLTLDNLKLFYLGKRVGDRNILMPRTGQISNQDSLHSGMTYEEVSSGVDLEYLVDSNRIKENIVIKERQEDYRFCFMLNLKDLKPQLSMNEKSIELVNDNGEVKYIIPEPVMVDNEGDVAHDVSYDLIEDGDELQLMVTADSSWINDEKRAFPVRIDPQIIVTFAKDAIVEHYLVTEEMPNPLGHMITISTPTLEFQIGQNRHSVSIYIMSVDLSSMKEFEVTGADLSFAIGELTDLMGQPVSVVNLGINHSKYLRREDITSIDSVLENSTQFISSSIMTEFHATSYNVYQGFNSQETRKVSFIMHTTKCAVLGIPKLRISYKAVVNLPDYYLQLNQCTLIESIANIAVEIGDANNICNGVLTTNIDAVNEIVYQHYQVSNGVYIRTSISRNIWGEWKKISGSREVIGNTLYWTE